MPRRGRLDPDLPPLPAREKRDQQVKIRLTASEVQRLEELRPDLTVSAIVSLLVEDVLAGRHLPAWGKPPGEPGQSS